MKRSGARVAAPPPPPPARPLPRPPPPPLATTPPPIVWGGGRRGEDPLVFHLPVAGLLLAVWLAFQTGDPAEVTVSAAPMSLFRRRVLRTGIATLVVFAIWSALCIQAPSGAKTATLSAFFAAAVCVSAAASAVGERFVGANKGGPFTIAILFVVFALVPALLRIDWSVEPTADPWTHLYGRWLLVAGCGVIVFLGACMDPARHHTWAR